MPKDKKPAVSKGDDKVGLNPCFIPQSDIVTNLHSAVTKSECQRVVNALVERDLVTTKLYGKQAVYVVRQDTIDTATPAELAAVDKEMAQLQSTITEYKSKNRRLTSELSALNSALTTEQIMDKLDQLTAKNDQSKEHLAHLRAGTQLVSAEEKDKVVNEMTRHRKMWMERRRLFKDMFATVTENLPGKPKDLLEELDIEVQDPVDINVDPMDLLKA
ncbi:hypothetical protein BG011_003819 [Mortierella polycephala]|uniref:Homologous-pairing protein 2 winged helix domain-containing protein n=1 Tax=Mortierella polycephala TaxID=41804 RepID=A0A9P6UA83_9FUNG|nr:hypothetical protein BG011_003819 [Mortierella polycephala]